MRILHGLVGEQITINSVSEIMQDNDSFILSSIGGNLYEGWGIHDLIKGKVKTIEAVGFVASSAIQILLAAPERIATENSRFLIHNPWTMGVGDSSEIKKTADELKIEEEILINKYVEISGKPHEYIKDLMNKKKVLMPSEALELNIVTKIKSEMQKEKKEPTAEKLNFIEGTLNKILNFVSPRAELVTDVNGVEINFDGEMAEGNTATANGEQANGEYILADGTILVFENGVCTSITEADAMDSEVEALKAEIEALKSENESLKNSVSEKEKTFNEFKAKAETDIQNAINEFQQFKSKFSNGAPKNGNTPSTDEPKKQKFGWKPKK